MEVHPASRDSPKYTLDANVVRRTKRATAGVQRRRLIKKHIQQKYLLCGFAIHAFLSTPAFLYGNVVDTDRDLILRIWPAIVYQASIQIWRSILEHLDAEYHGRPNETTAYRHVFLLATSICCLALMISGIFFSSAWVIISNTTQVISIVFYGFFAGMGSAIFIWKTHVILEAVRPREDKYVRRTIQLCGEAFCHFLSFVFTSLHTLYGSAQSIVLMSALLVNLIPLSLIITKHREGVITKRISLIKTDGGFTPLHHQLGRYPANYVDQMDGIDLQLQRSWRNPILEQNASSAAALVAAVDSHCNYVLTADEAYVTFVNPNGVEIMEIIPEEDENTSIMRASTATIDNYGRNSMSASQNVHKSQPSNVHANAEETNPDDMGNLLRLKCFSRDMSTELWTNLLDKIVRPLRKALVVPELYATTFLLSTDIFSYVMCLTVLPGLAVTYHAIKIAEIPFLYSLLAFPWMCFSLMTPRFGASLYKRKVQWHTLGCVCKGMALIFISFSTSKLLLSVSAALLGFGQAVTSFLQDLVFKVSMPNEHWLAIRHPVHFTNGILILIWGGMAHWVVVIMSFQATVGLAGALYTISSILWHLLFMFCKSTKL